MSDPNNNELLPRYRQEEHSARPLPKSHESSEHLLPPIIVAGDESPPSTVPARRSQHKREEPDISSAWSVPVTPEPLDMNEQKAPDTQRFGTPAELIPVSQDPMHEAIMQGYAYRAQHGVPPTEEQFAAMVEDAHGARRAFEGSTEIDPKTVTSHPIISIGGKDGQNSRGR